MKRFGLYVHIPYCLQICTYCDFVKFESRDLPPNGEYISLLQRELRTRSIAFGTRELTSIYFGGGTPSLFSPAEILTILQSITTTPTNESTGKLTLAAGAEITLEINPGTITEASLDDFLKIGVTRFSVGAQTFDVELLKVTGRKHSVEDTISTLKMLANRGLNYSFDLLFGLPGQMLEGVANDVARALEFSPSHLSAYNLTVPAKHPLNVGRASDDEQAEMFELIETDLEKAGIFRYEVSNFAKPGFESQHNQLYWSDSAYWGLGIGSHSYIPREDPALALGEKENWGVRFWNPATIAAYRNELDLAEGARFWSKLKADRLESLKLNEGLTDFAHTALRSQAGLNRTSVARKFGDATAALVSARLEDRKLSEFIKKNGETWILTRKGQAMADRVFEAVTFLPDDVSDVHS
jgi:oxygen-independent coproporphyrinogen-3 oxidase